MKERDYGVAQEFIRQYRLRAKHGKLPWAKAYHNIHSRCAGYSARDRRTYSGVKIMISSAELRVLFFRDKAYLMKQPSIDRIDPDGNYSLENIRWVENQENRKNRLMEHPARQKNYSLGKKLISDFLISTGWRNNVQKSFLTRITRELGLSVPLKNDGGNPVII